MFLVILWALVGLVAGGMAGGALADAAANHRGDIGALFGGLLIGSMFGALGGGAFGLWLARTSAGDKRKLRLIRAGSLIGIVVLVLGIVAFEVIRENIASSNAIRVDRTGIDLVYEIRLPADVALPSKEDDIQIELRASRDTAKHAARIMRRDGDRAVLAGKFRLYRVAPERVIALHLGTGPIYLFTTRLPERPESHPDRMSDWYPVDRVEESMRAKPARAPLPAERFEIRYTSIH
ncbi:MAG: hypothetical protein FJX62_07220 [Alphaproteobacteria bacterium]|nr:hypothetical protein [Alphaproteobacteria bacterium]